MIHLPPLWLFIPGLIGDACCLLAWVTARWWFEPFVAHIPGFPAQAPLRGKLSRKRKPRLGLYVQRQVQRRWWLSLPTFPFTVILSALLLPSVAPGAFTPVSFQPHFTTIASLFGGLAFTLYPMAWLSAFVYWGIFYASDLARYLTLRSRTASVSAPLFFGFYVSLPSDASSAAAATSRCAGLATALGLSLAVGYVSLFFLATPWDNVVGLSALLAFFVSTFLLIPLRPLPAGHLLRSLRTAQQPYAQLVRSAWHFQVLLSSLLIEAVLLLIVPHWLLMGLLLSYSFFVAVVITSMLHELATRLYTKIRSAPGPT